MVVFSERLKLGIIFEDWCKEHGASNSPENVLVFLQSNGLLNVEKTKEFLKDKK